ncbi:MAG: isoaspartyl peptidase/L-asparaginase [Vicingaceae bacterium]
MKNKAPKYLLAIHGGVGTILKENMNAEKELAYKQVLTLALTRGEMVLQKNGTALEATEAAIKVMEDSILFNAGKGSVFTHEGKIEMDASIMDGKNLDAGAVAGVCNIKNPISAALKVLQESGHILLMGKGAEQFALQHHCKFEDDEYFRSDDRWDQLQLAKESQGVWLDHSGEHKSATATVENGGLKLGTVGAVALDLEGNIAAATSTGGMTNKKFGRIGDTPIIGAGTYANNNTCAVSCTGHGEYFIKNVVAYDVAALMEYKKYSLEEAVNYVIHKKLNDQQAEAGLIALDSKGNYSICFNTEGMYRGVVRQGEAIKVAIYKEV